mmetsp:Transcript_16350/g.33295  ORF Transcript_16350/g.33295 Transcript_16350/m.33295 type:complete len:87 (+) Transcript_16350:133-393(+)
MAIVDRSATDYSPIRGGNPRVQVVLGTAAVVGAGVGMFMWRYNKRNIPRTMTKEWQDATDELNRAKPTEAGTVVVVNPIRHFGEKN